MEAIESKTNGSTKRGTNGEPLFPALDAAAIKGFSTAALKNELNARRERARAELAELDGLDVAPTVSVQPVGKVSASPAKKPAAKRAAKKTAAKKRATKAVKAAPVATAPKAEAKPAAGEKTTADYVLAAIHGGARSVSDIETAAKKAGWKSDSPKPKTIIGLAVLSLKKAGKIVATGRNQYALA